MNIDQTFILGVVASIVLGSGVAFLWKSMLSGAHDQIFGRMEGKLDSVITAQAIQTSSIDTIKTDVKFLRDSDTQIYEDISGLRTDLHSVRSRLDAHLDNHKTS